MPKRAQTSRSKSIPAPIGGLNARDALANMPETDAVLADNVFIQPSWVETRNGYSTLGTFTGQCETLMAYNAITGTNQLYAAVVNGSTRSIFRVDNLAGGAVAAAVVGGGGATIEALTSTRFDWAQFGTGSAEVLILVNGADTPLQYDGTTWTASTIALSGPASSTLNTVAVYKQRLWFTQKNTMNVWYLAQNAYTGTATQLNMASDFQLGGYLQAIVTVSVDNSAGTNDYIGFVSNVGEVVVFQGYDPAQASTWFMVARFRIGRPVANGRRTWQKIGSDALMIGADGFIKMSEAMLTDRSQTRNAVSDKIRKSVTDAVSSYGTNFGWHIILHPIGNKIIVNVPTTSNSVSYQYCMNTLTGAWSTWNAANNGFNAFCWETMGDNLYFGANGFVAQADTGYLDGSAGITWKVQQAYSYMDSPGIFKRFTQCRPIFIANGAMNGAVAMSGDFDPSITPSSIPLVSNTGAVWNSAPWNTSEWGGSSILSKNWVGLTGSGFCGSLIVSSTVKGVQAQWQVTDVMYEPGGPFG